VFNKQLSAQNKKKRREITEVEVAGREESSLRETGTQMQLKVSSVRVRFLPLPAGKTMTTKCKKRQRMHFGFFRGRATP